MSNDPLPNLVHDARKAVIEAEGIAHAAGMRDLLPHLYAAHSALNAARATVRRMERELRERQEASCS